MKQWFWITGALTVALGSASVPARAQAPGAPVAMPVRYDAHRFFVRPATPSGDTLDLFTDTGGGRSMLISTAVERLGLETEVIAVQGADTILGVRGADLGLDADPWLHGRMQRGLVFVAPAERRPPVGRDADGMLGQDWFADRVWTFDYPARRLLLRAPGDVPAHDPGHRVPLAFRTDESGRRMVAFPRIRVEIDGDSLDLLFDTGASTRVTDEALAALGGGPAEFATSLITESVFRGWRERHPDWRVIEDAEARSGAAMIEVPSVRIAGYEVGPVWFTVRPDRAFREWMAQWMDRPLDGALGGSALRYFRVTVDYPGAVAVFERP